MDTLVLSSTLRSLISAIHKGLRKQVYSTKTYSMTEMDTIGYLFRSPRLLPSELAALTKIKTQSMSQILKKMENQGVIARTPSTEDKRKVYISLTPSGKKMVVKYKYEKDEWLKGVIEKSLTDKEKEILEKALPVLKKLTGNK